MLSSALAIDGRALSSDFLWGHTSLFRFTLSFGLPACNTPFRISCCLLRVEGSACFLTASNQSTIFPFCSNNRNDINAGIQCLLACFFFVNEHNEWRQCFVNLLDIWSVMWQVKCWRYLIALYHCRLNYEVPLPSSKSELNPVIQCKTVLQPANCKVRTMPMLLLTFRHMLRICALERSLLAWWSHFQLHKPRSLEEFCRFTPHCPLSFSPIKHNAPLFLHTHMSSTYPFFVELETVMETVFCVHWNTFAARKYYDPRLCTLNRTPIWKQHFPIRLQPREIRTVLSETPTVPYFFESLFFLIPALGSEASIVGKETLDLAAFHLHRES